MKRCFGTDSFHAVYSAVILGLARVKSLTILVEPTVLKKSPDLKQAKPCVELKLNELRVPSKALCVEFLTQ